MASENNPSICNMKITEAGVAHCNTETMLFCSLASGKISNKQLGYLQTCHRDSYPGECITTIRLYTVIKTVLKLTIENFFSSTYNYEVNIYFTM